MKVYYIKVPLNRSYVIKMFLLMGLSDVIFPTPLEDDPRTSSHSRMRWLAEARQNRHGDAQQSANQLEVLQE